MGNNFLLVYIMMFLCACSNTLPADKYIAFVTTDLSLVKEKKFENIRFRVKLIPKDYKAMLDLKKTKLTKKELEPYRNATDVSFFMLEIKSEQASSNILQLGISTYQDYQARQQYFLSGIQDDIHVTLSDGNEIPCSMAHTEQSLGQSSEIKVLLGFTTDIYQKDFTFYWNDRAFGTGPVNFYFSKKDLSQLPELETL